MPTENEIMQALSRVIDPELGRNLVELNMIRELKVQDGRVSFVLALTIPTCPLRDQLARQAVQAVSALPGVKSVEIIFGEMTPEERQAVLGRSQPAMPKLNPFNRVERLIAVMSGKGGVGKSSVTALLAVALNRRGKKVGILDADITGPSIPKLFGLPPGGLRGSEQGILPAVTAGGIRVVSTNLLLQAEDTAVIWRGPLISSAIQQFWRDVLWGKLDMLLVDLPPGTSDAALTVVQSLPINGVILVTTPQELATMVVRKAAHLLEQVHIPVVGVVENMSYFRCPECGSSHDLFGPSHLSEITAAFASPPAVVRLPLLPSLATLGDAGQIEQAEIGGLDALVEILTEPK